MKKLFPLLVILFFSVIGFSQSVTLSGKALFGLTNELQTDSVSLSLYNHSSSALTIDEVLIPTVYETQPYSVNQGVGSLLPPNDSLRIRFYFHPDQNIFYDDDILVTFDNGETVVVEVEGQAKFSNSYYSSTRNKEEENLKNALKSRLAAGFNSVSYTTARDFMYGSIDNNGGTVECVYTGRTANFNSRAGANANNFNCEHTFPQSKYNSNQPMRADIHHLFPTDASANSTRSNHPFGTVNNPSWNQGGSKYGNSTFEPRDVHKGDAARAMLYFVTRYQDYQNFFGPQENVLRQWHEDYPPTASAKTRNDDIENVQNNRNPFVDYPQLVKRITTFSGFSSPAVKEDWAFNQKTVAISEVDPTTGKAIVSKAITNTGNVMLQIFNPQFSDAGHEVLNVADGDTIKLAPGEAYTFLLEIDPTAQSTDYTAFYFTINNFITEGCDVSWDPVLRVNTPALNGGQPAIFPNPANGQFFVRSNERVTSVEVYDMMGKEMPVEVIASGSTLVITHDLNSGMYVVESQTEKGRFRLRLLIQ